MTTTDTRSIHIRLDPAAPIETIPATAALADYISRCTHGEPVIVTLADRMRHPDTGRPVPVLVYCHVFGEVLYAERAELALDLIVAQAAGMTLEPGADLAVLATLRDDVS